MTIKLTLAFVFAILMWGADATVAVDKTFPPCVGYYDPDCPTPFKCDMTDCEIPTEQSINESDAYAISDIGLPTGSNSVGLLTLRPQDMTCPPSARWDDKQTLVKEACRVSSGPAEDGDAKYAETLANDSVRKQVCFKSTSCKPNGCEHGEARSETRVMTKVVNGVSTSKQYQILIPECSAQGTIVKEQIDSSDYVYCNESKDCPKPATGGGQP